MIAIRPAAESDLDEIWRIQSVSGQAAQWNAGDYLMHTCLVGVADESLAGFAVARATAPNEMEILSVAVDPAFRRRGMARALIRRLLDGFRGAVFLEVRQSNLAARKLYHSLGFEVAGVRPNYYTSPGESAIVMKFHSC